MTESSSTGASSGLPRLLADAAAAVTVDKFLQVIRDRAKQTLGCDDLSVYFLDGATGGLREFVPGRGMHCGPARSIEIEPEVVELFTSGKPLPAAPDGPSWLPAEPEPLADARRLVGLVPVSAPAGPLALFVFTWRHGPEKEAAALSATEEGFKRWGETLCDPSVARALQRARLQDARVEIAQAAGDPGMLGERAAKYVDRFLERLRQTGHAPEMLALQIVDQRRHRMRTLLTEGVPVSFRNLPPRLLEPDPATGRLDIQAHVVKSCRPEVIAGNDVERFDQETFHRYRQSELVRLWIPLFPVDERLPTLNEPAGADPWWRDLVQWHQPEETEGYTSLEAHLVESLAPPADLVFGTLEIGYRRRDAPNESGGERDLYPFDRDFANRCLAWAWEDCAELFRGTLFGALERMGRAVASVGLALSTELSCYMRRARTILTWRYPDRGPWPATVPSMLPAQPADGVRKEPLRLAATALWPGPPDDGWQRYRVAVRSELPEAVRRAVPAAFRVEEATTKPYELRDPKETRDPFGTKGNDQTAATVCREAAIESGAETVSLLRLERGRPAQGEPPSGDDDGPEWRVFGPVVRYPESAEWERPSAEEAKLAVATASFGRVKERPCGSHIVAALPLELDHDLMCVVLLRFPEGAWKDAGPRWLEARAGGWALRLSRAHTFRAAEFSRLIAALRRHIAEVRDQALAPDIAERHTETFISLLVSRLTRDLDGLATFVTREAPARTGPQMSIWSWCMREREKLSVVTDMHFESEFLTPDEAACQTNLVRRYSCAPGEMQTDDEKDTNPVWARSSASARKHGQDRTAATYDELQRGGGRPWTLVVLPAQRAKAEPGTERAVLSVLLPGSHQLRRWQARAVGELGHLVGDALRVLRRADENDAEARHRQAVDVRGGRIRAARRLRDVSKHLFTRMGHSTTSGVAPWRLADHAVVWVVGDDGGELAVLSARGNALRALEAECRLVLRPTQHPLVSEEQYGRSTRAGRLVLPPRGFRPRVFGLRKRAEWICSAYRAIQGVHWLLTFPVVNREGEVFGVIDCLRQEPLSRAEDRTLGRLLLRLSTDISTGVEQSRLRRTRVFARTLFDRTRDLLSEARPSRVYETALEMARRELDVADVDLYLARRGRMTMIATTRQLPAGVSCQVCRYDGKQPSKARASLVHAGHPVKRWWPNASEESSPLRDLLKADAAAERIAIPIRAEDDRGQLAPGLLYAVGLPASAVEAAGAEDGRARKRSGVMTAEHLRLARSVAEQVERVVQLAQLAEHDGWLVRELVHALGQPLQVVRASGDDFVRALASRGQWSDAKPLRERLEAAFDMYAVARDRLGAYARLIAPTSSPEFRQGSLTELVQECCDFLAPLSRKRANRIDYSGATKPCRVPYERESTRLALVNLLDNATKYSFQGRPVEVSLNDDGDDTILLRIVNRGVGIPPDGLERVAPDGSVSQDPDRPQRIFLRYYRSKAPDAQGMRPGTGVGLTVVWEAIRQVHAGRVWATSAPRWNRPGEGLDDPTEVEHETTFHIALSRSRLAERLARWPALRGKVSEA